MENQTEKLSILDTIESLLKDLICIDKELLKISDEDLHFEREIEKCQKIMKESKISKQSIDFGRKLKYFSAFHTTIEYSQNLVSNQQRRNRLINRSIEKRKELLRNEELIEFW